MGSFTAGQIVLLPFPFSDLSQSKIRPALLLGRAGRGDWIACQITSNPYGDPAAISLDSGAFARGDLQRVSYIRPGKLFTGNESIFTSSPAVVHEPVLNRTREAVITMIRGQSR